MNKIDILNKIIEENGSCGWAKPGICDICPLSKLHKKTDGTYLNCVEAVGVIGLSSAEANEKYKAASINTLFDNAIQDLLEE